MQLVNISRGTARALSKHVDRIRRLKLPIAEPQIQLLFEKAIKERTLTPQEMFILSRLVNEDAEYGKDMANLCATLGAKPGERLREHFHSLHLAREALEATAGEKSESERVKDFYQTVGVMVLEYPYCAEMVSNYLGPESDALYNLFNELGERRKIDLFGKEFYELYGVFDTFSQMAHGRRIDVLDVGFGKGRYLIELSRRENLHVVGIDYSLLMQLLTRRIAQLKGPQVNALDGDATRMAFPDGSFDVTICMYNTLGNIPEDVKALGEMRRVTRKGGLVIVSLLSEKALPYQLRLYDQMGLTVKEITEDRVYTHQGLVSKRHTKSALKNLMGKVGLDGEILEVGIGYIAVMQVQ